MFLSDPCRIDNVEKQPQFIGSDVVLDGIYSATTVDLTSELDFAGYRFENQGVIYQCQDYRVESSDAYPGFDKMTFINYSQV